MSILLSKRLFSRWFVILPISLTVACSGPSCRPTTSSSSSITAASERYALAAELREALMKAHEEVATALRGNTDFSRVTSTDLGRWLEQAVVEAQQAERELPRETFDTAAIVKSVGADRQKLFDWVKDNTYLIPYRGVLRGSTGVLMDRLGNSLDRALLLADLLQATGGRVRLAHGLLSQEQASSLMSSIRSRPKRTMEIPTSNSPAIADGVKAFAAYKKIDPERLGKAVAGFMSVSQDLLQELERRVGTQAAEIRATLADSSSRSSERQDVDIEAMRDHWWVQHLQNGTWTDFDPTRQDASPAQTIVSPEDTLDVKDVPDDLYHSLTIRVVVEGFNDGKLRESKALEHAFRPWEVIGQRILLRHRSLNSQVGLSGRPEEFKTSLAAALRAQTEWLPVLSIGGRTITQSSFTDSGAINDSPRPISRPSPTERAMGGMLGGLGGEPDTSGGTEGALTAEWIEYEIRTPGKASQTIRRDVFDLIGPEKRSLVTAPTLGGPETLTRAMALVGETDIVALTCQFSHEFVQHLAHTNLLNQVELMRALVRASASGAATQLAEQAAKISRLPAELYGFALARNTLSPVRDDVYLDQLNIVSTHRRMRPGNNAEIVRSNSFDIVENSMATQPAPNAFQIRLTQGLIDTAVENLFVGGCVKCEAPTANVSELWVASRAKRIGWVAISKPEELEKVSTVLNRDARRRVERDLGEGYTVLLPTTRIDGASGGLQGWWRIDPKSGSALGVMESGEGQSMTEYVVIVGTASLTAGGYEFWDCMGGAMPTSGTPASKTVACLICAGTTAVAVGTAVFGAVALLHAVPGMVMTTVSTATPAAMHAAAVKVAVGALAEWVASMFCSFAGLL